MRRLCLAALLAGGAGVFAFAPSGWFALNWLCCAGLYFLLSGEREGGSPRRAALIGASYGFGLFLAGVSWVYVSLSVFGGMPAAVAALATLSFCALLASFPALAAALFVALAPTGRWRRALLFASLWALAEWSRTWVFSGFPWLAAGYSQAAASPLAGYAPLFGVHGVSFACALIGALAAEGIRCWRTQPGRAAWRGAALPVIAIALVLGSGEWLRAVRWTQLEGEPLSVALLQGNVAQEMKWRPERFVDSLRTYHQLARENPARLTVLPETALPAFLDNVPPAYLDALRELARREQGDLLIGLAIAEGQRYFNSVISLGASPDQRYDKVHLVPFGEFVPAGFAWFMALAEIPMSDFAAGSSHQPALAVAGQKVGVNICYEDAFGEAIIGALPEATLLVNVSNVAWFGDSLAPAQHLQIAQMRALETGRMMLRATNTGMTAIVDVDGRVQAVLPPFTRGALVGEVHGYSGATPYVRWGNWPILGLAVLLVAVLRRRHSGTGSLAAKP